MPGLSRRPRAKLSPGVLAPVGGRRVRQSTDELECHNLAPRDLEQDVPNLVKLTWHIPPSPWRRHFLHTSPLLRLRPMCNPRQRIWVKEIHRPGPLRPESAVSCALCCHTSPPEEPQNTSPPPVRSEFGIS